MGNQDGVQGPSLAAILDAYGHRLDVLERLAATAAVPAMADLADFGGKVAPTAGKAPIWDDTYKRWVPHGPAVPFSLAGALTVSTSPPYPAPWAMTLDGCNFALGAAGSTSTVVAVYKNGVSQFTQTIAASATTATAISGQNIAVAKGDLITVGVTSAGTGASNLGGWVGIA